MVTFNKYSSEAHANFVMDYGYWHKADPKRAAFVYLLGILKVTREHIRLRVSGVRSLSEI